MQGTRPNPLVPLIWSVVAVIFVFTWRLTFPFVVVLAEQIYYLVSAVATIPIKILSAGAEVTAGNVLETPTPIFILIAIPASVLAFQLILMVSKDVDPEVREVCGGVVVTDNANYVADLFPSKPGTVTDWTLHTRLVEREVVSGPSECLSCEDTVSPVIVTTASDVALLAGITVWTQDSVQNTDCAECFAASQQVTLRQDGLRDAAEIEIGNG